MFVFIYIVSSVSFDLVCCVVMFGLRKMLLLMILLIMISVVFRGCRVWM